MKYKELIEKMTLEQKASLMSGKDFWQTQDIPELGIPGIFLADGPHGIRKQALAADHLGLNASIPATCFPTAATIANSWDENLGEEIGRALGEEASAQQVNVLLGPGINIKRNPQCGRNFEYFSEDPYLTGKMAAAYIRGIQSKGVSACVKHFCANNQETKRMAIDTIVDERSLREIYLTAFEIAVQEGETRALMSSYNKLNGTYANENPHIMDKILRKEWGFEGCVVTDWGGGNDRVAGLAAGNELEMPTTDGETDQDIIKAVREGELDQNVLDEAVDRLLELIFSTSEAIKGADPQIDWEQHHELARKAAEASIVLLKNEASILPLNPGVKTAVIGDFAQNPRYQGAGSSIVNPHSLDSFTELAEASELNSIGYAQGYSRYGKRSSRLIKDACRLASAAEKVLLFLGLDEYTEVEGLDRKDICIPANQIELLDEIYKVNQEIVIVLSSGAAVEMPWLSKAKALLHGYLSGQAGAGALLNIITGKSNPSGKLAETYPLNYEDVPSATNYPGSEATVEYREGLYIGYRYFSSIQKKVLFPFGFGLGYTEFEYSDLIITEENVTCTVRNTGTRAGAEIAQLYVRGKSDKVFRPDRELKGFIKVYLEAGEAKTVTIPFDDKTFRYFNTKTDSWETEELEYQILVGSSSEDLRLSGMLRVSGSNPGNLYNPEALGSYFSGDAADINREEFEQLLGHKVPDPEWDRERELGYTDTVAQCRYAKGGFARFGFRLLVFAHSFLKRIGNRDAANLIMSFFYHIPFRGIVRMTGGVLNMPMLDGLLIIVNGHFFRGLKKILKERRKMIKKKRNRK